jgi:hypothetical protein
MFQDSSGGFAAGSAVAGAGFGRGAVDGGDGDAGGEDDDVPVPDGGSGGDATGCSALPFGCVCSPTEPTQVRACTATSVVTGTGQRGVCCSNPFRCICASYECVRTGGACTCQLATTGAGARVDDCSGVTDRPSIRCCLSYGQCVCSSVACLLTEAEVPNCSVQTLLGCPAGEGRVETCEPAGAAAGGQG